MLKNVDTKAMESGTVTVHLRTGVIYENCDFPNALFSENERIVSFWVENKMYNIPIDLVKSVIFTPGT